MAAFSAGWAVFGGPIVKLLFPLLVISLLANAGFYYEWRHTHAKNIKLETQYEACKDNFQALIGADQITMQRCEELKKYYENLPKAPGNTPVDIDDNAVLNWLRGQGPKDGANTPRTR